MSEEQGEVSGMPRAVETPQVGADAGRDQLDAEASPTAVESVFILGVLGIAAICIWLLWGPLLRGMLGALARAIFG